MQNSLAGRDCSHGQDLEAADQIKGWHLYFVTKSLYKCVGNGLACTESLFGDTRMYGITAHIAEMLIPQAN
jgi:hypothetical protein